jgi:RimJ/RimL family protein N-acetyltransferase
MNNDEWRNRMIITPRLNVRAFQPEDGEHLFAYLSNGDVYRFEPGEPVNLQQAQKTAIEFASSPDFWAVVLRSEQQVIGQIYLHQIEPHHLTTWELGYILNPAYQRRGYAGEAVSGLLRGAFATGAIHRVIAHCNPENVPSWKLLERIGFRREGVLKKETFFRRDSNGCPLWTDTLVYALLDEEYLPQ